MTRKEQIWNEACHRYADSKMRNAFVAATEWADSHPNWIPVERELPKEENAYLVSDGDGVLYGYFIEGRWAPTELNETCTHWMPLPPPPRKEE